MDAATIIQPVILCGGSGTRLWPLSRKSYPKQFVELIGDQSLFELTIERFSGENFAAPMVVTNDKFRFIASSLMSKVGIETGSLVIEPEGRNTAPAALVAAMLAADENPERLILLAPSDHRVPDKDNFVQTLQTGADAAAQGQIVTFGVRPSRAETGYGYLALRDANVVGPQRLEAFVEKPDAESAREMVASGRHLWNAGIFLARADVLIAAFVEHAPELIEPVRAAVDKMTQSGSVLHLDGGAWSRVPDISIDYAVMEYASNLSVVPFTGGWSDLGGWDAVWTEMDPDSQGVATSGPATVIDCSNSLLRSESDEVEIVGIGLDNIVAVAMNDAVLIADKSRTQDVKKAVAELKAKNARQATEQRRDYRPWGWYESLALGERFQVKRIVVDPGAALSLQSHVHRSEHWIVVQGTAEVTVDETVKLVSENESIYIPLGAVHRMKNPGKLPLVLIEVQTGSYLGEDDIVRYEDVYERA